MLQRGYLLHSTQKNLTRICLKKFFSMMPRFQPSA